MTVAELIEKLSECDPDANVLLMSQPGYPFEWAIAGVAIREHFEDTDEDSVSGNLRTWDNRKPDSRDVFLLEGDQLRYGSREAWDARI